jgi:hypothetical protein
MHFMFFTLLVVVAIVGMVLLFVFWLVVTLLRAVGRLLVGPRVPPPAMLSHSAPSGNVRPCDRPGCRALNPVEARFCRRCGQKLEQRNSVYVRRVAMY